MIPFIAAIIISLSTIFGCKFAKSENKAWAYPLILSLYPVIYFCFALYANDNEALFNELIFAIPIFFICIISAIKNIKYSAFILAVGYIGHAIYDIIHHQLFINSGTPLWWPEFCGTVDLIIGIYLIFFAVGLPNNAIVTDSISST